METENVKKIYELLNKIPETEENKITIEEIKECLINGDFITAVEKLKNLQIENDKEEQEQADEQTGMYPKKLSNLELEYIYIEYLLHAANLKFLNYNFI